MFQERLIPSEYRERITCIHAELGITRDDLRCCLPIQVEAEQLVHIANHRHSGKTLYATSETVSAWELMEEAAKKEGVNLYITSAYRSAEEQALLIKDRIGSMELSLILNWLLAPGYSEHHTGCALDIVCDDSDGLPWAELYETKKGFQWLQLNAKKFGFLMSYGKNNDYGIIYEPWHWTHESIFSSNKT